MNNTKVMKNRKTAIFNTDASDQLLTTEDPALKNVTQIGTRQNKIEKIFKSNDLSVQPKIRTVQTTVLSVDVHGCESWTTNKREKKSVTFGERLLRVMWTIRKQINGPANKERLTTH